MRPVAWCNPMRGLGAAATPLTLLIGDSLAVGLTKPLGDEFTTRDQPFKAFAKGGTTVANWLTGDQAKSLTDALVFKPHRVLVALGTNDTNGKIATETLKTQVAQLVGKIRAAGAEVVWLMPGTLPWNYDSLFAAVAGSNLRTIDPPPMNKPDKIHPDGAGYNLWAKKIYVELLGPAPQPSLGTAAKASIAPLIVIGAIVGLAWWLT